MNKALRISDVQEVMASLAACLCAEVESRVETGESIGLCVCGIVPGNVMIVDYCFESEDCQNSGMGWVRLAGITGVRDELNPACATTYTVLIEVGIVRGALPVSEVGIPTQDEQTLFTLQQLSDMEIMRKAIKCCPLVSSPPMEYNPMSPEGGCVGGVWTLELNVI